MLKLIAFAYLLERMPCVHAGDLINSGPVQGMGAMTTWLMIAALASSFGGAEAQYNPGKAPSTTGITFGNDEIYETCRLAAHQACLLEHDSCKGFHETTGFSYEYYQLGCQFYNQGYKSEPCCDLNECNDACVRCVVRCGNCHAAAASSCTHISLPSLAFASGNGSASTVCALRCAVR
jgi:hypothetical protein